MFKYLLFFCLISSLTFSQENFSVYFDTNKFDLNNSEKQSLNQWIIENPKVKIVAINGYTDEDGSVGLNDTLALRRVETVNKLIQGKIAIREDFKTRSFGKMHKQDANKAKNRRATIFYLLEKDIPNEAEILGLTNEEPKIERPKHVFPNILELQLPNGKTDRMTLDTVFMNKLDQAKTGDYLVMKNLNFMLNTFAVVKESVPRLYELLLVLQQNPDLVFEIHGHICCNTKDHRDLSTNVPKPSNNFWLAKVLMVHGFPLKVLAVRNPNIPYQKKMNLKLPKTDGLKYLL